VKVKMRINSGDHLIIAAVFSFALIFLSPQSFSQVRLENLGTTKKNKKGGYDFYSASGEKVGYSTQKRRSGAVEFYDAKGNKRKVLKKSRRGKSKDDYTVYSADGAKEGALSKKTDGTFSYQDEESGQIIITMPGAKDDVTSLSIEILEDDKKEGE